MASLNRVQLIGRLGRDPEMRYTPKGTPVHPLLRRRQSHLDQRRRCRRQKETDWFNIEAWGKLGEICQQYLKKGKLIYVEGRLHTDRWEDDKGETQYMTKIVATGMQMLDRKPEEPEAGEFE